MDKKPQVTHCLKIMVTFQNIEVKQCSLESMKYHFDLHILNLMPDL